MLQSNPGILWEQQETVVCSGKGDSGTKSHISSSLCPLFQGFPARIPYNIPRGKAPLLIQLSLSVRQEFKYGGLRRDPFVQKGA